jgi:hypothetical protein
VTAPAMDEAGLLRRYCDALECVQELRAYLTQAMPMLVGETWKGARAALIRSGVGAELPEYSDDQAAHFIDWDEERRQYAAEHGTQGRLFEEGGI